MGISVRGSGNAPDGHVGDHVRQRFDRVRGPGSNQNAVQLHIPSTLNAARRGFTARN